MFTQSVCLGPLFCPRAADALFVTPVSGVSLTTSRVSRQGRCALWFLRALARASSVPAVGPGDASSSEGLHGRRGRARGRGSGGSAREQTRSRSKLNDEKEEQAGGQDGPSRPHLGQPEASACLLASSSFPGGRPGEAERHSTGQNLMRGTQRTNADSGTLYQVTGLSSSEESRKTKCEARLQICRDDCG